MPIEQGDSLAGTVQGFSMAEMEEQCDAFAPSMAGYQARLASQAAGRGSRRAPGIRRFRPAAPPAQMSGSARICLGIGYRTDNAEVALAAALVLVGLGEEAYGELRRAPPDERLRRRRSAPTAALEWLEASGQALEAGASPLVANGSEAHAALLQQAVAELTGGDPKPVLQDAAAPPASQGFAASDGARRLELTAPERHASGLVGARSLC